tara:strand:- start:26 stop:253 length:228 start_codon:yes stop_codon:yes gene_type:complete
MEKTMTEERLRYGIVYQSEYDSKNIYTHSSETWKEEDKVIDLKNALQEMSPKRNYQIVTLKSLAYLEDEHLEVSK